MTTLLATRAEVGLVRDAPLLDVVGRHLEVPLVTETNRSFGVGAETQLSSGSGPKRTVRSGSGPKRTEPAGGRRSGRDGVAGGVQRERPPDEVVEHRVGRRSQDFVDLAHVIVAAVRVDLAELAGTDRDGVAYRRHVQLDPDRPEVFDGPYAAVAPVAERRERLAHPLAVGLVEGVLQDCR